MLLVAYSLRQAALQDKWGANAGEQYRVGTTHTHVRFVMNKFVSRQAHDTVSCSARWIQAQAHTRSAPPHNVSLHGCSCLPFHRPYATQQPRQTRRVHTLPMHRHPPTHHNQDTRQHDRPQGPAVHDATCRTARHHLQGTWVSKEKSRTPHFYPAHITKPSLPPERQRSTPANHPAVCLTPAGCCCPAGASRGPVTNCWPWSPAPQRHRAACPHQTPASAGCRATAADLRQPWCETWTG